MCAKKRAAWQCDFFTKIIFKNTIVFMMISAMGAALADIADALVLGLRLGEDGLAAISFVTPIYMLYNVLGIGLATGGAICYAKLLGAGKSKAAVSHFTEVALGTLILGIVTAALGLAFLPQLLVVLGVSPGDGSVYSMTRQYAEILLLCSPVFFLHSLLLAFVRSDDGAKIASVAFIAGSIVDICLNVVFIFALNMGVVGAAYATVLGVVVGIAVCLCHVCSKHTILRLLPCKPNFKRLCASFATGLSTSTQSAWNLVFFIVVNNLLMQLNGAGAVAVFDVTLNVSYLALATFSAGGEVLRPMVSTFVGERNKKAVTDTLHMTIHWGLTTGLISIATLWLLAQPLCSLFGLSPQITQAYGSFAVRCYLCGAVAGGISTILMDYYQAVNRERMTFFISLLRGFVLFLPAAILCGMVFGVHGIWLMFPVTEFGTLALVLLCGHWQKRHQAVTQPKYQNRTWLIHTREQTLTEVLTQVEEFAQQQNASLRQSMLVVMMVEEICSAIMQSGFRGVDGCIQITLLMTTDGDFELHIRDNAPSFNLFEAEIRRVTSAEDEDAVKSLPVILIRKNAKAHFYRRFQGFNTLSITIGE